MIVEQGYECASVNQIEGLGMTEYTVAICTRSGVQLSCSMGSLVVWGRGG